MPPPAFDFNIAGHPSSLEYSTKMTMILDETADYRLSGNYETVVILNKITRKERALKSHYGDPARGIISPDQDWVICGGKGVNLHFIESEVSHDFLAESDIHTMRLDSPKTVRILVDPWSDQNSTWMLDIETLRVAIICGGPDLREEPYRDNVSF